MTDITLFLIALGAGILAGALSLLSVFLGSWITFKASRQPGSGEGFLTSPKGEVFNIVDEGVDDSPGNSEPTADEQAILKNTNRFLKVLGGE